VSDGLEPDVTVSTSDQMLQGLEAADITDVDTPTGDSPVAEPTTGVNPSWESALSKVPSVYHSYLTEEFKKWDSEANNRITSVQSRFKPYQEFVDQQIDPDMLKQSIQLMNVFQNDPEAIFNFFVTQGYGQPSGQGQKDSGSEEFDLGEEEIKEDPRLNQLEQQQQLIMQQMQAAQAKEQQIQGDMWLSSRQAELTAKHEGVNLDWDFVLTRAMLKTQQGMKDNDLALEMSANEYVEMVNKIRATPSAGSQAPRVMPTSGGVQSSAVNVRKLGDQGRKDLVLEMMQALDREDT
jgi:hypothetical protein